ncbi:MAG: TlpA family protein disulfide reductase [Chloroflexi bacterium]|nr:TlpA family protein disulfide reductase [Chloroflexota bacterium]
MTLALLLPWILLAVGAWLAYQFLLQHGRILLRLESVEEQLQQIASRPAPAPAPTPATPRPEGLPIGHPAPGFTLPDLAGKPTSLSAFAEQRILLVFFNLKCGFCQKMAPALKTLTSNQTGDRPRVVVVSTGDRAENLEFFRTHGIDCPVLLQKEMEVASLFQVQGTPMGYVLDEQGRIASGLAAGEPGLLALLDLSAPGSPVSAAAAQVAQNGSTNGSKNGRHTEIGKGSRSLENS